MARAKHAHKQLEQILVAISGSFVVKLDDGVNKVHLHLDKPRVGLYVPPMTWVVLEDFSAGAVCLVLASEFYYESDYHRDYDAFLKALNESDL
jgi:hypothetical protein